MADRSYQELLDALVAHGDASQDEFKRLLESLTPIEDERMNNILIYGRSEEKEDGWIEHSFDPNGPFNANRRLGMDMNNAEKIGRLGPYKLLREGTPEAEAAKRASRRKR